MENIIKKREKTRKGFIKEDWPKSYLEKINCPLCKSSSFKKLYPSYYERLVQCIICGLIYTNPRLKKKYLKHLYSKEYFQNENSTHFGYENYLEDQEKIIATFTNRVKKIEPFKEKGKLLDIGCATGFFMKAAKNRGWDVTGVEISDFAAQYAHKHFKFKVYTKDFLTLSLKNEKYDLITMWDVIEHFYDPILALKKVNSVLKKDGLVVISTPDVDSWPSKVMKERWVGYKLSDEHLTYFSPPTISQLLNKAGFTIVKTAHVGKHVSLPMLADRATIYNPLLGRIIRASQSVLPKNHFLYVNPFDIMCIYAKKTR